MFFPVDMYKVSQDTNDFLIWTHFSSTSVEQNEKFKNCFQISQELRAPSRSTTGLREKCLGLHKAGLQMPSNQVWPNHMTDDGNQERGPSQVKIFCPIKTKNSNKNFKLISLRSSTLIQKLKTHFFNPPNRKVISVRVTPMKSPALIYCWVSRGSETSTGQHFESKVWKVTSGPLVVHLYFPNIPVTLSLSPFPLKCLQFPDSICFTCPLISVEDSLNSRHWCAFSDFSRGYV